jgi:hypothetical protein
MMFTFPAEFCAPEFAVAELRCGAEQAVFEKLSHNKGNLKQTNMNLSDFLGEPTEAKGIVSKELTIGSKTMPTTFSVVDVKGRYCNTPCYIFP